MRLIVLLLLYVFHSRVAQCANILHLSIFASPSHHVWNRQLVLGLVERGHNVTTLTHNREEVPVKNWTLITVEGIQSALAKSIDMKKASDCSILEIISVIHEYSRIFGEVTLKSPALRTLLNYPKTFFDLIIYDTTVGQCLYPLVEIFGNPPVVAVNLLPLTKSRSFGAHVFSSYMPYYSTGYEDKMDLIERVLNFVYVQYDSIYHDYIAVPKEFELALERFGSNILPFHEVEKSVGVTLLNTDAIFDYPVSLPPNVIPVGGLQIRPAKKLPRDLQEIFNSAQGHGVVLVSFGTNVHDDILGEEGIEALLAAFGRLEEKVIWKYSTTRTLKVPGNVVLVKWIPQGDILGHPNLKLFVSQCGGFSYQEAIYHGVPVVAVPFLIDQYTTATRLVKRKLAVKLDHRKGELTTEKIFGAIQEVLHNPMYRENMKVASEMHRDQLQTPLERGIFWIEYLLRHGGAKNLVPIARSMSEYQLANFDVYLFFGTVLVLIYTVVTWLFVVVKYLLVKCFEK